MRAGKNDTLFDVEEPKSPETRTASGAITKEWQTFAAGIWGQFTWMSGDEKYSAEAFQSESLFMVKTRPISGLTSKMRLVTQDSRTFDILSVDDMTSRAQTILKVKLGRSKGN